MATVSWLGTFIDAHAVPARVAITMLCLLIGLNNLIAEETGQTVEKVTKDSDRNFWMNADEACEYGLVSKVVKSATELA